MGVFDGVHAGHRALLSATARTARSLACTAAALIFDPHPDEVIRPGGAVPRLTPLTVTAARVRRSGARPITITFSRDVMVLSPERFLDSLAPGIELRALVMTSDSAFGHRRSGTPDRVATLAAERGFELVLAPVVEWRGQPISSSRIRRAIVDGDLSAAAAMLGTPPTVHGTLQMTGGRSAAAAATAEAGSRWALEAAYRPALPPPGRYRAMLSRQDAGEDASAATVHVAANGDGKSRPIITVEIDEPARKLSGRRACVALVAPLDALPARADGRGGGAFLVPSPGQIGNGGT